MTEMQVVVSTAMGGAAPPKILIFLVVSSGV